MNKHYLILGLCGLLAFAACNEELDNPNTGKPGTETPTDVITTDSFVGISYEEPVVPEEGEAEVSPGTKVTYHKKGNVFSAQWSKEDCIYVTAAGADEEITLQPFQLEGEGGEATGKFVGEPISGTTFSAVFSKAVPTVSADKKSIEVLFPAEQNYVAEGLEEHLVPMFAVTSDPQNLKFQYGSGILRLNLYSEDELSVSKIEVVTDVPAAGLMYVTPGSEIFPCGFSGGASVNDMEGVEVRSGAASTNTVTYNVGGVAVGKTADKATQFNIALAASNHGTEVEKTVEGQAVKMNVYKEMIVRVYTTDGKVMAKVQRNFQVLPGVVHDFSPLPFTDNSVPEINYTKSTSTSLTFAWSQTGKAKNDVLDSYEVALYSDEACQTLVVSWTLPSESELFYPFTNADNADYAGFPAFTFTGLAQNTDYWCKVKNLTTGAICSAAKATTGEFTVKTVGTSKVAAGDVVLAEDFSELVWGGDFVTPAAGYVANSDIRSSFSKATGADNSNYSPREVSKDYNLTLDIPAAVAATERLSAWDYICEDGNTANNGLRVYSCASYLRIGSGSNTSNIVTPVLSNLEDGKNATLIVKFKAAPYYDTNDPSRADLDHIHVAVVNSIAENHKYADCTIGNVVTAQLNGTQNEWKEYTLEISGVTSSSRIAIGTYRPSDVSGNIRMFLDDVEITVKKYDEVKARLQGATSSTLSFQWSGNNFTDAEADTKMPYTVALYEDAACATLVASWNIEAGNKNYHTSKDGVDYYFQPAFNFSGLEPNKTYYFKATDTQNNLVSNVVSATTEAFTNVKVEEGTTVAAGEVALAEDFSELTHSGDFVYPGISLAKAGTLTNPSTETDLGSYFSAIAETRLKDWTYPSEENSSRTYGRLGHLKLGGGSYTGRIITPALSNLQQTATLKVSFKASPYYDHNQQSLIDPLDACIKVIAADGTETSAHKFTLKDEKNKWNDYSFTVLNVEKGDKISIGTYRATGKAKDCQRRMYIDDIKIEVVEYTDAVGAKLQRASSSTLTFIWSPSGFTDAAADRVKGYTVSLYSDAEFTKKVVSWNLSATAAGSANWYTPYSATAGAGYPAFIFSGLDSNATYYFKVEGEDGWSSEAVGTTEAFDVVTIGDTKVAQGGTVLAEDFADLIYGLDMTYPAVGYRKTSVSNNFVKANAENTADYTLYKCSGESSFGMFDTFKNPVKNSRLKDWGYTSENGSMRAYSYAGYVKLGGGYQIASIVTPELTNLEDGKLATVTVSFKACPFYDSNKSDAPDNDDFRITLFRGETSRADGGKVTSTYGEVEMKSGNLNGERGVWKEYSYDIENVSSTSRIAIGVKRTAETGKHQRMYIDEIKIVVKEYVNPAVPEIRLQNASSSTLSFQWSENEFNNVTNDRKHSYLVALYKDAACSELIASSQINRYSSLYKMDKYYFQPAFSYGGLTANTSYWFKVTDIESGLSNVMEGKTTSFNVVPVGTSKVEVGETVLAEDFAELVYGGDMVFPAVSYRATTHDGKPFTTPAGSSSGFSLVGPGTDTGLFNVLATAISTTDLKDWGYINGESADMNMFARLGYLKVGGYSKTSMIVTPVLSNLKGTAKLKVSFKASPYYNNDQKGSVDPLDARVMALNETSITSYEVSGTEGDKVDFKLTDAKNVWTPYSYDIENVEPGSRIAIGTWRAESDGKQRRMFIDDIVITVVSYNE